MNERPTGSGADARAVKDFYAGHHDRIRAKRHESPFWIRRYAHQRIHSQVLAHVEPGMRVLDAGCGEGVLACLAAAKGARVVGAEISGGNIEGARELAVEMGVEVEWVQADAENLPFADRSFEMVISSHVLEHLPDMDKGLSEIRRITDSAAVIAMPTCLSPAGWILLGGDVYWRLGIKSLTAAPRGLIRTALALARGEEGPDEGYGGSDEVPHVWRFPWVMRRRILAAEFEIERFEAGPLLIPFLPEYLPPLRGLQKAIDSLAGWPLIREFGFGSMAVCRRRD